MTFETYTIEAIDIDVHARADDAATASCSNAPPVDEWHDLSYEMIERYLDVLTVEYRVGSATRMEHHADLRSLDRWLVRNSQLSLVRATEAVLLRYLDEELARSRTAAIRRRRTMRRFYAWLRDVGCREEDPMQGQRMRNWWSARARTLVPLRRTGRLGPALMSRDRMIFALMLTCGLETRDIAALKLKDLALDEGVLLSRKRRIKLRPVLSNLLKEYLENVRPRLLMIRNSEYVFPSSVGGQLYPAMLRNAVTDQTFKFWRSLKRQERSAFH